MGMTAGILTMGSAVNDAMSQRQQANAITTRADINSSVAKQQADDAIARGQFQASARSLQGRRAVGAQRAAAAASGVDPNSGSALDLESDEARFSALDSQTIRNNAAREAWGYTTQAAYGQIGAKAEAANLRAQSVTTLLTGAGKTYGLYSHTKAPKTTAPTPMPYSTQTGEE